MTTRKLGFFKKRYRTVLPLKQFDGYNVSITPTLSNNDETINFAITSELPANLTCNYVLLNTVDADWVGANATGSVTLDSTGNANVTATLDPDVNFDYVSNNVNLIFQLNTTEGGQLGTSSNVTFIRGNTFSATGGVESQISGSNLKIHSYTTAGSHGFNITNLGPDPANTIVRQLVVGGGGRGGDGYHFLGNIAFTDPIFGQDIVHYGGGGGAGGVVTEANVTANTYSIANLSVTVGAGSNVMGQSGANSSFDAVVSVGGGSGAGANVDTANANSATFYDATAHTGGPGGGGVRQIADQFDFRGANGSFTGGTARQTVDFPNASGNVLTNYHGIMSGAGASQNAQPNEPHRVFYSAGSYSGPPPFDATYYPYTTTPGWVYSPANASVGTASDITGTSITYGGGGGGGPVPVRSGGVSNGHWAATLNDFGLGVDGGGNGGHPANGAFPNTINVTNNRIVGINGNADLLAQPGIDNRGGGGGGGTTVIQTSTQPDYGVSSDGGKGGDGVVYVTYPFYIRRMQV